jgi:uncharacterized protein (TIGR02466 family)
MPYLDHLSIRLDSLPDEAKLISQVRAGMKDLSCSASVVQNLLKLADIRQSLGDTLLAEAALAQAHSLSPDQINLAARRANLLNLLLRPREARKMLQALSTKFQDDWVWWAAIADNARYIRDWRRVLDACDTGLGLKPSSKNMQILRATALGRLGDWEQASKLFAMMKDNSAAVEMQAAALAETRGPQAAIDLLNIVLAGAQPKPANLSKALAMLHWMCSDSDNFNRTLEAMLSNQMQNPNALLIAADLLGRAGRTQDGVALLKPLIETKDPMPAALSVASLLVTMDENPNPIDQAELLLATSWANVAAELAPRQDWIRRNTASCLLRANRPVKALAHTIWGLERNQLDQEWIALDVTARRALGDQTYRQIYDYERFVRAFDIEAPASVASPQTWLEDIAHYLRTKHQYIAHPLDQSLRGGSQLQLDPNSQHDPLIMSFFEAIKPAIASYIAQIGGKSDHPFTARTGVDTQLSGCWSVRLKSGGSHVNHIHPEGWISSAFYVQVPADMAVAPAGSPGHICFGAPRFPVSNLDFEHAVAPKAGRLVLFPSYMWHGVIPFHDEHERLSIALDIVPI